MAIRADGEITFSTAELLWQQGQTASARIVLEDILARDPDHSDAVMLLGKLLQGQGMLNAACDVVANLCRRKGMTAATTFRCGQFIQQCQRQPLAGALCEEAVALGNESAELHVLAGNIARELGNFDSARTHYLTALEAGIDLNRWFVLGALASIQRYEACARKDFERLAMHFRDTGYSARSRATSGLGLAKAYDDVGDYTRAATALREANLLLQQSAPWSRQTWTRWLEARLQCVPPEALPKAGACFVPVFIVGLPRTGTTLVARQLARHQDVCDRGELNVLNVIADRLQATNSWHDADALREAAALYRTHVVQDDPPVRWYIDKDPNNFRYLDLIAALFPQARIIHCIRSRPDTALSIWSQSFARSHYGFANNLADIADFFEGHDRLMQHWQQYSPLPIYTLSYEVLIDNPESTLEELRQFVGLPSCSVSHASASPSAITSSSLWQARQPMYASSVGRWRNYASHVPELRGF